MPGIYWYVTSKKTANSFKETVSSLEAERRHCDWFKLPTIQNRLFRPRDQNGSTSSEREKKMNVVPSLIGPFWSHGRKFSSPNGW